VDQLLEFLSGEYASVIAGAIAGALFALLAEMMSPLARQMLSKLASWSSRYIGGGFAFRRYERQYLDYLVNSHKYTPLSGIRTRSPVSIPLESIYVPLRFTPSPSELGSSKQSCDEGNLLSAHSLILLIGGPGTGKTTFLKHVALSMATGVQPGIDKRTIPIYVQLRSVVSTLSANTTPAECLTSLVKRDFGIAQPRGYFERLLTQGRCLLLLDGLDEVPPIDAGKVTDFIQRLIAAYPDNAIIATSRPIGLQYVPTGFAIFEVCGFTVKQIQQCVSGWSLVISLATFEDEDLARRRANKVACSLFTVINENPRLLDLASNPLLLSILVLVHYYRAQLPQRRAELYQECLDILLQYWDVAKGLEYPTTPLTLPQKRQILEDVAWWLHQAGRTEVAVAEAKAWIRVGLDRFGIDPSQASQVLEQMISRTGVLTESSPDTLSFQHISFQEYLVALRMVREDDMLPQRLGRIDDPWWREVILLYAAIVADASQLVSAILRQLDSESDHKWLVLASECLIEAQSIKASVREEVIERLIDAYHAHFENEASSTDYLRALGRIRGNVVNRFLEQLQDDRPDIRARAAFALGEIASISPVVRDRLASLLNDERIVIWRGARVSVDQVGRLALKKLDFNLEGEESSRQEWGNGTTA